MVGKQCTCCVFDFISFYPSISYKFILTFFVQRLLSCYDGSTAATYLKIFKLMALQNILRRFLTPQNSSEQWRLILGESTSRGNMLRVRFHLVLSIVLLINSSWLSLFMTTISSTPLRPKSHSTKAIDSDNPFVLALFSCVRNSNLLLFAFMDFTSCHSHDSRWSITCSSRYERLIHSTSRYRRSRISTIQRRLESNRSCEHEAYTSSFSSARSDSCHLGYVGVCTSSLNFLANLKSFLGTRS